MENNRSIMININTIEMIKIKIHLLNSLHDKARTFSLLYKR